MNMDMEKDKKDIFLLELGFFLFFFFIPILLSISEKKRAYKIKDFFVPNSYVFNRWIGAYSGLESCLGEYCLIISTNLKPQLVFFVCILCKNVLLDNLQNFHFHYKSVTYLGVSNHPLVFVQPPVMIIHVS
jgi:hypothetical protein